MTRSYLRSSHLSEDWQRVPADHVVVVPDGSGGAAAARVCVADTAAHVLDELLVKLGDGERGRRRSPLLYDRRERTQRRRSGKDKFTIHADGSVTGVLTPRTPRRVYIEAFARELSVDENNFIACRDALADRAPTPLDAETSRSLTWPLMANWRRMLLREDAL